MEEEEAKLKLINVDDLKNKVKEYK